MEILILILIAVSIILSTALAVWTSSSARRELDEKLSRVENNISSRLHETRESQLNVSRNLISSVEIKLEAIRRGNDEKLEEMRRTVDEKLHKSLEEKLGESFRSVSERLERVHCGLGEMHNLAQGVGDLKRVLTNVKARGIFGEIQLENILEQLFTPEQYDKNIVTRPGASERVEFALKLPGKGGSDFVYLPIDSKFPAESYDRLQDAYEAGDAEALAAAGRELEQFVRKSARDIKEKYIAPPHTTDFGVLFLPTEGLFAEVLRRPGLAESLQRENHIIPAGPTTLSALLNSLQIGFRTLAIEKRSSEVWKVLGAVKAEFDKFGAALEKTQRHISQAGEDMNELIGVRTRQIISKLKTVETLPEDEDERV